MSRRRWRRASAGGDRAAGVIVLEDLTPAGGEPAGVLDPALDPEIARFKTVLGGAENVFFALMRRDRSRAERLLLRAAAALGRLHVATAGREAEYRRLRTALGPEGPGPRRRWPQDCRSCAWTSAGSASRRTPGSTAR